MDDAGTGVDGTLGRCGCGAFKPGNVLAVRAAVGSSGASVGAALIGGMAVPLRGGSAGGWRTRCGGTATVLWWSLLAPLLLLLLLLTAISGKTAVQTISRTRIRNRLLMRGCWTDASIRSVPSRTTSAPSTGAIRSASRGGEKGERGRGHVSGAEQAEGGVTKESGGRTSDAGECSAGTSTASGRLFRGQRRLRIGPAAVGPQRLPQVCHVVRQLALRHEPVDCKQDRAASEKQKKGIMTRQHARRDNHALTVSQNRTG